LNFNPAETSNRRTWTYCKPDANQFPPRRIGMIALLNQAKHEKSEFGLLAPRF
jgi:hypothetical protein